MRIGYGRVSTRDQHPEAQHDALAAAGCEQIFIDKASGKLARRPELDKALVSANRFGDQLVITKLDPLGRSLEHLIELSKLLQTSGVDLVVLDQGIDTSTAVGRMFFQILGAIAEFEQALMSERAKLGFLAAGAPAGARGGEPVERAFRHRCQHPTSAAALAGYTQRHPSVAGVRSAPWSSGSAFARRRMGCGSPTPRTARGRRSSRPPTG